MTTPQKLPPQKWCVLAVVPYKSLSKFDKCPTKFNRIFKNNKFDENTSQIVHEGIWRKKEIRFFDNFARMRKQIFCPNTSFDYSLALPYAGPSIMYTVGTYQQLSIVGVI